MDILNQTLFKIGDSSVTFLSIVAFLVIIFITILISVGLKYLLNKKIFPGHTFKNNTVCHFAGTGSFLF